MYEGATRGCSLALRRIDRRTWPCHCSGYHLISRAAPQDSTLSHTICRFYGEEALWPRCTY